jgi:hypothetical protein
MMNGLLAVSALGTASISVIGTIVSGVCKITGNSVDYLWNGSTTTVHMRDYHRRIMQLDIPDKIKFIRLNVNANENANANANENDRLLDVADKIVAKLKYIESELVYHDTKWFAGYRNLAIEEDIKDLEALSTLLDNKLKFKS